MFLQSFAYFPLVENARLSLNFLVLALCRTAVLKRFSSPPDLTQFPPQMLDSFFPAYFCIAAQPCAVVCIRTVRAPVGPLFSLRLLAVADSFPLGCSLSPVLFENSASLPLDLDSSLYSICISLVLRFFHSPSLCLFSFLQ